MNSRDIIAILPLLIPAYAGVVLMLVAAFVRSVKVAYCITLISLIVSFGMVFVALPYAPRTVTSFIRIDVYSLLFCAALLAVTFLVTLLSPQYMQSRERRGEAYYILMLFAVTGMLVLASSAHFAAFFLGLETLSVSLYGLIGYSRRSKFSLEAAIKYLIMAAVSSGFLLLGIATIYYDSGNLIFSNLTIKGPITLLGWGLVLIGFAFKLAWVPLHTWSPDVYQGAPSPITALIASGSKAANYALLLRLVPLSFLLLARPAFITLGVIAVATMSVGNLLALTQDNIKRLLAYSSVAHMGYLFIPLMSGDLGVSSAIFYLFSYLAAVIPAFGVIAVVSASRQVGDYDKISDYTGLANRSPWLAGVLALSLLSLLGVPLTAGFFAKFYIFMAVAKAGLWWLFVVGIVNSGVSAFYYLRVVIALYARPDEQQAPPLATNVTWGAGISLAICSVIVVLLGVFPPVLVLATQQAAKWIVW
ncbi:MAG: NADH-quinone oxidoreductase subunit N [Armatimonadota bacterium]|jgi:NADH-quinone oxidoreductase subunit N